MVRILASFVVAMPLIVFLVSLAMLIMTVALVWIWLKKIGADRCSHDYSANKPDQNIVSAKDPTDTSLARRLRRSSFQSGVLMT